MTDQQNEQTKSERAKRVEARQEQLKSRLPRRPGVRIEPRDDVLRKLLKHPSGVRFPKEGSVEWPNDRFTKRRIADGSVKRVEDQQQQQTHERGTHQRRSHAPTAE